MNCVIIQPSYIPWRGYFDMLHKADVVVFYDDVQYDKHGWRNRNRIKTPTGSQWLTIPVFNKGNTTNNLLIKDININWNTDWNAKHWTTIKQVYGKAPYFRQLAPMLEEFYSGHPQLLADFTIDTTMALARQLGMDGTTFIRSSSLRAEGSKTDRLVEVLRAVGATHYISGPSAKDYLEEDRLQAAGISLEYMVYDYPEYEQLHPPFDPQVSILDLLFMKGPEAARFIWTDTAR